VRDADVPAFAPDADAARVLLGPQAPWPGSEVPRGRGEFPGGRGETEGQAGDVEMFHAGAFDEIAPATGLDVGLIGIGIVGQADVQPSAGAAFFEPVFAFGVVQVVRFVLEVVAHSACDDPVGATAGPACKAQAVLSEVDDLHLGGVGSAHHPAELRPDQRTEEIVWGFVPDMPCIDGQMENLAAGIRDGIAERPTRVFPDPPFAFDVVRVGDLPIGRAGEGNAHHLTVWMDQPNAAR